MAILCKVVAQAFGSFEQFDVIRVYDSAVDSASLSGKTDARFWWVYVDNLNMNSSQVLAMQSYLYEELEGTPTEEELDNRPLLTRAAYKMDVPSIITLTGKDPSVWRSFDDPDSVHIRRQQWGSVTTPKTLKEGLEFYRGGLSRRKNQVESKLLLVDGSMPTYQDLLQSRTEVDTELTRIDDRLSRL